MSFSAAALFQPSFTDRDNLLGVAWACTRALRVPVSLATLHDKLTAHPDYPSLLSVADVFDQLNIENAALRIDAEQFALLQVPYMAPIDRLGRCIVLGYRKTLYRVTNLVHRLLSGQHAKIGCQWWVLLQ